MSEEVKPLSGGVLSREDLDASLSLMRGHGYTHHAAEILATYDHLQSVLSQREEEMKTLTGQWLAEKARANELESALAGKGWIKAEDYRPDPQLSDHVVASSNGAMWLDRWAKLIFGDGYGFLGFQGHLPERVYPIQLPPAPATKENENG